VLTRTNGGARRRSLVVIGASAGGLKPLQTILGDLPPSLPAATVIVVHTRSSDGLLPEILTRRTGRPVEPAVDGSPLEPGRIYVAPADFHVLVSKEALRVVRGPRENGFRPAIDPLFRSAARWRGVGVVGVILSGALDDGSYGLRAIVRRGGAALVQDPEDAEMPYMPAAALRETAVDAVLPAAAIGPAIVQLCNERPPKDDTPMAKKKEPEPQQLGHDTQVGAMERLLGPPSPITCPACGGALWESEEEGRVVRYACHVGHQYSPDSLLADHTESVEQALWSAIRVLEQHADLRLRMSRRAEAAGLTIVAEGFAEDSRSYHRQAREIRRLVFGVPAGDDTDEAAHAHVRAR
jgi:two-component system chemotaxis response regulator CheB